MVDYLCLKLSWDTDKVLDNAHFDNVRKLMLYIAMDEESKTREMFKIPVFDGKMGKKAAANFNRASKNLQAITSGKPIDEDEIPEKPLGMDDKQLDTLIKGIMNDNLRDTDGKKIQIKPIQTMEQNWPWVDEK